jgi:hypothetical protein
MDKEQIKQIKQIADSTLLVGQGAAGGSGNNWPYYVSLIVSHLIAIALGGFL